MTAPAHLAPLGAGPLGGGTGPAPPPPADDVVSFKPKRLDGDEASFASDARSAGSGASRHSDGSGTSRRGPPTALTPLTTGTLSGTRDRATSPIRTLAGAIHARRADRRRARRRRRPRTR